jgi:hypothetical protein
MNRQLDLRIDLHPLRSIWSDEFCKPRSANVSNVFKGGYDTGSGFYLPSLSTVPQAASRNSLWETTPTSSGLPSPLYSSGGSEPTTPRELGLAGEMSDIFNNALNSLLLMNRDARDGYLRSEQRRMSYDRASPMGPLTPINPTPYDTALERIEKEAKMRRSTAYLNQASVEWKGALPSRTHINPTYATKVFIGGLPYDVTMDTLQEVFGKFGLVSVQFPPRGRGHAYLVFDSEDQIKGLLNACECKSPGQFFYWVSARRGKDRKAQVIPWVTEDSDWLANEETSRKSQDKQNTVFVGALHGEITAKGLQLILSELFGSAVHVGIDTDKNRYPNGSARVSFASKDSFNRAVSAEFVQVVTPRFSKTIQLDAYIEDGMCSSCMKLPTPVFCRHPSCFRYYCPCCFEDHREFAIEYHPPVMRNRNQKN